MAAPAPGSDVVLDLRHKKLRPADLVQVLRAVAQRAAGNGRRRPHGPPQTQAARRVRALDASHNPLKALPSELPLEIRALLAECEELRLAHCGLRGSSCVERFLAALPRLVRLDLSHNHLARLAMAPSSTLALQQLRVLDLGHNQLTSPPQELEALASLQALDLSHNRIPSTHRLRCLSFNTRLRVLALEGNPLTARGHSHRVAVLHLLPSLRVLDGTPFASVTSAAGRRRRQQLQEPPPFPAAGKLIKPPAASRTAAAPVNDEEGDGEDLNSYVSLYRQGSSSSLRTADATAAGSISNSSSSASTGPGPDRRRQRRPRYARDTEAELARRGIVRSSKARLPSHHSPAFASTATTNVLVDDSSEGSSLPAAAAGAPSFSPPRYIPPWHRPPHPLPHGWKDFDGLVQQSTRPVDGATKPGSPSTTTPPLPPLPAATAAAGAGMRPPPPGQGAMRRMRSSQHASYPMTGGRYGFYRAMDVAAIALPPSSSSSRASSPFESGLPLLERPRSSSLSTTLTTLDSLGGLGGPGGGEGIAGQGVEGRVSASSHLSWLTQREQEDEDDDDCSSAWADEGDRRQSTGPEQHDTSSSSRASDDPDNDSTAEMRAVVGMLKRLLAAKRASLQARLEEGEEEEESGACGDGRWSMMTSAR